MRSFLILVCSVFSSLGVLVHAEHQYVVAVQEQKNLKFTDGSGWTLEIGEVFPLIRWVSAAEKRGGTPDPNNRDYAALQMDTRTLVVPATSIRLVEQRDLASAAMTYRQIVQQSRENQSKQLEQLNQMLQLMKTMESMTPETKGEEIKRRRAEKERQYNDPVNKLQREIEALRNQMQQNQNK